MDYRFMQHRGREKRKLKGGELSCCCHWDVRRSSLRARYPSMTPKPVDEKQSCSRQRSRSGLPLLLVRLPPMSNPLQYLFTILVELQLRDLHLAGRDADRYALAVALLACDTLDVDNVFETVHRDHLALATFVRATLDDYFVIFADGDCANLGYDYQNQCPCNISTLM